VAASSGVRRERAGRGLRAVLPGPPRASCLMYRRRLGSGAAMRAHPITLLGRRIAFRTRTA
jgi:hypothetical protein